MTEFAVLHSHVCDFVLGVLFICSQEVAKLRKEQAARKLMAEYMNTQQGRDMDVQAFYMASAGSASSDSSTAAEKDDKQGSGASGGGAATAALEADLEEARRRLATSELVNEQLRIQLSRAEADLALSGRASLEAQLRAVRGLSCAF